MKLSLANNSLIASQAQKLKQKGMKLEGVVIRGGPFDDIVMDELSSIGDTVLVNEGTEVRITVESPYPTIRRVVDILEKHDVYAFVSMAEPSLEDAFAEIAGDA